MNRITVALGIALLAVPAASPSQDTSPSSPKKSAPANDIFSGTVAELGEEYVTVVRTALAQPTVKRTFVLDARTTMEGKLRPKARVTVRYATGDNGQFHALHIIVR